ncbi:response regulator transcription factor [Neoroseomonas alba]|uniref:response regulator transcription factor n=1 Tax=Roseomonas alba TaxID=2846776 RepID=UPI002104A00F|nr:response regulator [Neoroseomonas alba]
MMRSVQGGAPPQKPAPETMVSIVDDDTMVRESLDNLFRSVGFATRLHGWSVKLLAMALPDLPGRIILDVRLPGISGLDLQAELARIGIALPIVFMTGHGDIPISARAMNAGAVDLLAKPFLDPDLLDVATAAIARGRLRRHEAQAEDHLRGRYDT